MNNIKLLGWEIIHYSLLAASVTTGITGTWAAVTGYRTLFDVGWNIRPGRLVWGALLIIAAVVLAGIFQDMRLDHLCAIHGTC